MRPFTGWLWHLTINKIKGKHFNIWAKIFFFAIWNFQIFMSIKVESLLFQMKTYWGLEPLFIFDIGRGENFNEWLLCVSETMLWVHLSCSGAVGWGTLAAKHEWDEWNHLWQTDTGARAWVIQQNAVLACISISFNINSHKECLNIQIHALQMAKIWEGSLFSSA